MVAGLPARPLLIRPTGRERYRGKPLGTHAARLRLVLCCHATTMLATVALAGAASSQSRRLVNRAGLFQQVSIMTGLGWLTALSARALTRMPATRTGPRQSHSLAIHDRLQWPAGPARVVAEGGGDAGFSG